MLKLNVPDNSFFVKQVVDTVSSVQSDFGDLPLNEVSSEIKLSKVDENKYVTLSGSTANDINYGDYELKGGYLSLYVTETDLSKTSGYPPSFKAWNLDSNIPLKSGGFTFPQATYAGVASQTVGDKLTVVNNAWTAEGTTWKRDNFTGDNTTLFNFENTTQGVPSTRYWMKYSDWQYSGYAQWCSGDLDLYRRVEDTNWWESYDMRYVILRNHGQVPVLEVMADADYYYLSFSMNTTTFIDLPLLSVPRKFMDLYGYVHSDDELNTPNQLASTDPLTFGMGQESLPSTNNTIFDAFKNTLNISNPYDSDDNNPLLMTHMEIATDKANAGNTAFRFYHNWGGAPAYTGTTQASLVEKYMGKPNDATPQVLMAGVYNIPDPVPLDAGYELRGDRRQVLPYISMDMLIEKLPPCPRWAIKQSASGSTTFGTTNAQKLYYGWTTTNPTGNLDVATVTPTTSGYIDYDNNSFSTLRCVAIVFSNFKPLDTHKTLDDFLDYGLTNAYGNGDMREGVIGGVIMRTFNLDGTEGEANQFAYAQALPVTRNPNLRAPYGTDGGSGYDSASTAGDVGYYGMGKFLSGTANTPTSFGPHTIMNRSLFNDTTRGMNYPTGSGVFLSGSEKQVELPLNSYFNIKFHIDAQAYNWTGSQGLSPYKDFPRGTVPSGGSAMRVVFDTNLATSTIVDGDLSAGDGGQSPDKEKRFLDIPFPVGAMNSALTGSDASDAGIIRPYTFIDRSWYADDDNEATMSSRAMWPKHMTIWVQNYRWIKGDNAVGSWFKTGDDTVYSSPVSMETEVYIDNIEFTNFTPPIANMTASQDAYSRGSINNNSITSPYHRIQGTKADGSTYYMGSWFNGEGTAYTTAGPSPSATQKQGQYLHELHPGNYLLIGMDEKTWLPNNVTDGKMGYLLLNDFATPEWTNLDRIVPSLSSGAIFSLPVTLASDYTQYLGNQFRGNSYRESGGSYTNADDAVHKAAGQCIGGDNMASASAPNNGLAMGTGSNSIYSNDGITQKGFMQMYVSGAAGTYPGYTEWTKREHILASTKIMHIPATDPNLSENQIMVHNPKLFNMNASDDKYVLYLANRNNTINTSGNTRGLYYTIKVQQVDGNIVTFDNNIVRSDQSNVDLCTEENLSQLWVGPKKYWMTAMISSDNDNTNRTFGQIALVNETPSDSDDSQLGGTFNEWLYHYNTADESTIGKAAVYTNTWDLRTNSINSFFDTDFDYGHGVKSEDNPTGGYVDSTAAVNSKYSILNLKGLVHYLDDKKANFNLYLNLDGQASNSAKIASATHSTTRYRPNIYYEYHDPVPVISDFSVKPAFNLIDSNIDVYSLTSENLNSVIFNWKEDNSRDIWYRYIIKSTKDIPNKYTHCRIHVPLNNAPTDFNTRATFTATDPEGNTSYTVKATGSSGTDYLPYSDITGLAGWAPKFEDDIDVTMCVSGTSSILSGASQFSIVCHGVPDSTMATSAKFYNLYSHGGGGPTLGTATADSRLGVTCAVSGNKLLYDQRGLSAPLTGTTFIPFDGQTPMNVMVTYDSTTADPYVLNIYLNGVLEMSSNDALVPSGTSYNTHKYGDLYIGGNYAFNTTRRPWIGSIDEFVYYDKPILPVEQAGNYVYNLVDIEDVSSGVLINHTAKLFAFDYHNIRGSSPKLVAESNLVNWRATTL